MKKLLIATSILISCQAWANNSTVNPGASMTMGPSSSSHYITSGAFNPAMGSLLVSKDEKVRMSYFPTFGLNTEIGPVDNFADDLSDLADIIDDPSSTNDDTQTVLDRFNQVLVTAGQDGYIKFNVGGNAPLLPVFFYSETLKGTIGFDYSINGQARVGLLDSELYFDSQKETFTTASSLYIKSGIEQTFAISYARMLYETKVGKLHVGGKFKYIDMELSKQVQPLVELAGLEISDVVRDEYDQNQISSATFAVDLGLVWEAENYRLGLTLENINSPEFNYGEVGVNCSNLAERSTSRTNCEVAKYFSQTIGVISTNEIHTKHALARVDGLVQVGESVSMFGGIDLAKYDDITGDDHQWVHAGVDYQTAWFVLPAMRLAYHKNLTGSETSSLSAGVSLFGVVSVDVEYGLESIEIDDSTAPRRLGFAISIQEQF